VLGRGPRGEGRGKGCWASGGPCGREEGRRELGWAKDLGCFLSFFFSFSFLYSNIPNKNYLNSNKFEFKSYKLHTRKAMLQHECTSKLML
jgi:hypothetical protein